VVLYSCELLDMNYCKSCCHGPGLKRALAFMCMSMIGFIHLYARVLWDWIMEYRQCKTYLYILPIFKYGKWFRILLYSLVSLTQARLVFSLFAVFLLLVHFFFLW